MTRLEKISMLKANFPISATILGIALLVVPLSEAHAQSPEDRFQIHGFGGWAYSETDGNRYFLGTSDGETENVQFALNIQTKLREDLTVIAQVFFENSLETLGEEEIEIDYLFAEWAISSRFKIRAGRVKHPVGNYGEVVDVGTIRPFYMLPRSVYGPEGVTAKAYIGVGVLGGFYGDRWGLHYHVYGGEIESVQALPGLFTPGRDDNLDPWVRIEYEIDDVYGFKLDVSPPFPGWTWGIFGHQGEQRAADPLRPMPRILDYDLLGTHLEYLGERWELRAEATKFDWERRGETESFYVETAYRLSQHWQIAVRYDDFTWNPAQAGRNPLRFLIENGDDLGLALNYWLNSDFVLRLNYHFVEGNRFAFPGTSEEIELIQAGGALPDEKTEALIFGVQFSF